MDGFFDAADDLLDSIQTKKTNKTPVKRPHEPKSSNNDDLIQKTGSGPAEKKMKYDLDFFHSSFFL